MDIKGKISLMLKSKGFGEMFLYSINHKNSLVDASSLKAKNLDSLKYIMRVTTIEKLLGKSSEEEVAWKDYKELYKSVCGSIDTLKKYCSALEKQSETNLKKRIEKYNEQKERGDFYKRSTRKIQIGRHNNMVLSRKRKLGYTFGKISRKLVPIHSQKPYFTLFKEK